jgi:hypothetical protein
MQQWRGLIVKTRKAWFSIGLDYPLTEVDFLYLPDASLEPKGRPIVVHHIIGRNGEAVLCA